MTVAIVWILAQMEAPWWVITILIAATLLKISWGFLRFLADYERIK